MQADLSEEVFAKLAHIVGSTVESFKRELVRKMPKTDLHVHGEAGFLMDIPLARELAKRNSVQFPEYLVEEVKGNEKKERWKYRGTEKFSLFIDDFLTVSSLIRTAQDIEDVCYAYYRSCYENNVIFTLPGISWVQCKDHMTMAEFHAAYNRALSRGTKDFGDVTVMRFRYYLERHLALNVFNDVLEALGSTPNPFVTTVGLAGDETGHPFSDFKTVYTKLKIDRKNPRYLWYFLTAHMERHSSAAIIYQALELLDWIAHGWNAGDDDAVIADMRKQGITFEVCPLSDTHCVSDKIPTVAAHTALPKLLAAGLATLNSDDPAFFGHIGEVYEQVSEQLGVSIAQLLQCTERGLNPASPQALQEMQATRRELYDAHMKLVEVGKLKIDFFKIYLKLLPLVAEAKLDKELAQRFLAVDLKTSTPVLATLSYAIPVECQALKREFSGLLGIKEAMVKMTAEVKKDTEVMMLAFNERHAVFAR